MMFTWASCSGPQGENRDCSASRDEVAPD